jgi:hypothetical protein
MSILIRYVWFAKVCLTGYSAFRSCYTENSNVFICFLSGSYFLIICLATLVGWKTFATPRKIDGLEGEYLRRLEEGLGMEEQNHKSD